jgi:hypothetical protein
MSSETDKPDQWRLDVETVMKSMHERICALEGAVISQQKMMEAMASDALKPKLIRPQLRS